MIQLVILSSRVNTIFLPKLRQSCFSEVSLDAQLCFLVVVTVEGGWKVDSTGQNCHQSSPDCLAAQLTTNVVHAVHLFDSQTSEYLC